VAKPCGAAWGRKTQQQCAALPMSQAGGELLVLLVTSRGNGRWVIPKGWAEPELPRHALAAREAFEEAGVLGTAMERPLGAYTYRKRMPDGRRVTCQVTVFALYVSGFANTWPEQGQRRSRWVTPRQAARLVREPELAGMLRGLGSQVIAAA